MGKSDLAFHSQQPLISMKNYPFFFAALALCVIFACNSGSEEQNPNYDANLASMKAMFDGFQSKTINPDLFADDFIEVGTGFQEEDRTKDESMQQWKMMTALMDAELVNAVYLPGIDTLTMSLDGSVRYYGQWNMTMGDATQKLMAYGTMEFNDAGEIRNFAHYADWTATFGALLAENPDVAARIAQRAARSEQ